MGVKAVMARVEKQVDLETDTKLYTYGPLIHNPQVTEKLRLQGVESIETPAEADAGAIVIRAHGIHPEERKDFINNGYEIIEGTCPRVLKSQKIVIDHSQDGWFIVIVGDKGHGEVKAIVGCADKYKVILTESEAEELVIPAKTLVIAQTTLSKTEYDSICRILLKKDSTVKIVKSICPATSQRQESLTKLTKEVDAVVVVGGKNSANTRRLYLSAVNAGIPSWHVEDVDDLPDEIYNYETIGITAGASTPDWVIDRIEEKLLSK